MTYQGNAETIVVKGEGITLSLLVWRRFKRKTAGYVERVLDINPGLADLGPILPVGTAVVLPLDAEELRPEDPKVVKLWD